MAFFKANYYSDFISALLDSVIGNETKTQLYLREAKGFGINIIPPTVNNPTAHYQSEGLNLHIPLLIIKQIGITFFQNIKTVFQKGYLFSDIFDFMIRLEGSGLNYQTFKALCYSGALDCFNINRTMLDKNYDLVRNYVDLIKVKKDDQIYYDYQLVVRPAVIDYAPDQIIEMKREIKYLGFYITKHPVAFFRETLNFKNKTTLISNLKLEQQSAFVMGFIKKIRTIKDKNANLMAFVELEDESGSISITAFSNIFQTHKDLFQVDKIIRANIRLEVYKDKLTCNFNTVTLIE